MSAAPTNTSFVMEQPAPRGVTFISLDEAARRSGKSIGHLARLCRKTWASMNLAKLAAPKDGGKPVWTIREDAAPELSRCPHPEHLPFDLSKLSAAHGALVIARENVVLRWKAQREQLPPGANLLEAKREFCQLTGAVDGVRLTVRTLEIWTRDWTTSGRAGLVDERRRRAEASAGDREVDPFLNEVKRHYLHPNQIPLMSCWRIARSEAARQGWTVRTYKAAQRFVATIPAQVVVRYREGEKAFNDRCEPAIERDYSSIDSNAIWCGDDHRFDVMVLDPKTGKPARPWLCGLEDVRSRKIVGYHVQLDDPNTDTILCTFADAAAEHGLPQTLYVDNGKAWDSRQLQGQTKAERYAGEKRYDKARLQGAMEVLGDVRTQHVWAFHGQSKPVERAFGTVCARFSKLWLDGYCGNSTQSKPETLYSEIKDKGARARAKDRLPTFAEFVARFDAWLKDDYNNHVHLGDSMDGLSPAAAFDRHLVSKRAVSREVLWFACLPRYGPYKVAKQGVTHRGLHFGAFAPEMQKLYGKQVFVAADPRGPLAALLVLDLDGRLLACVEPNRKLPWNADHATLKAAIGEKKRLRKTLRAYVEQRPRMTQDLHTLVAQAAIDDAKAREAHAPPSEPPPPTSIRPHRTPFEDQLPTLQRAMEARPLRAAVGAESLTETLSLDDVRRAMSRPQTVNEETDTTDAFAQLGRALQRSDDD